jgi:hypothetical protein
MRGEFGNEIGPGRCLCFDHFCSTSFFNEPLTDPVHFNEISTHSFLHDLLVDVHHVSMADPVLIDHTGHLDAGTEFSGLCDRGKDARLRSSKIVQDHLRHILQRTFRILFHHEYAVFRTDLLDFVDERSSDLGTFPVRNDRDPFFLLQPETIADGVPCSIAQCCVKFDR